MDEELIRAALALDPTLKLPQQAEFPETQKHESAVPGVLVNRVLARYDRDGSPVYIEPLTLGGCKW